MSNKNVASLRKITMSRFKLKQMVSDCLLVVCPLLNGAGTRIKILEAMAHRKAVVSTSVGAEGLEITNGENILIGDSPATFAGHCVSLLKDPTKGIEMGSGAYELVKAHYDFPIFEKKMGEMDMESFRTLEEMRTRFLLFTKNFPNKFAQLINSPGSTGEMLIDCKNCKSCFDLAENVENCRYMKNGGFGIERRLRRHRDVYASFQLQKARVQPILETAGAAVHGSRLLDG